MVTLQDALNDLDDLKCALYDLVNAGQLDENINDQVQELLRDAYGTLEGEVVEDYDGQPDEMQEWHDFDPDC